MNNQSISQSFNLQFNRSKQNKIDLIFTNHKYQMLSDYLTVEQFVITFPFSFTFLFFFFTGAYLYIEDCSNVLCFIDAIINSIVLSLFYIFLLGILLVILAIRYLITK